MIEILSSWAKGLGITIVIVSIFEMLLPNNKTKKYITEKENYKIKEIIDYFMVCLHDEMENRRRT